MKLNIVDSKQPKSEDDLFAEVNRDSSALEVALQIQKVAERYRFDWDDVGGVMAKLREEMDEIMDAKRSFAGDSQQLQEELGDFLFTAVSLARHLAVPPEAALRQANQKFEKRFKLMIRIATQRALNLDHASKQQLESLWQAVKEYEKRTPSQ